MKKRVIEAFKALRDRRVRSFTLVPATVNGRPSEVIVQVQCDGDKKYLVPLFVTAAADLNIELS